MTSKFAATALACLVAVAALPARAQLPQPEGFQPADFNAVSCVKPRWPRGALSRMDKARVVEMAFLVGADGMVRESKVVTSSGFPDLDAAALDATAKCRFTPAYAQGQPVDSWLRTQYVWTLD